jgi:hypothetical protein
MRTEYIDRHVLQFLSYSVFLCLFVAMETCLPNCCQQRSVPRCQGNVPSEAPPSNWSYSGFQASCDTILSGVPQESVVDITVRPDIEGSLLTDNTALLARDVSDTHYF